MIPLAFISKAPRPIKATTRMSFIAIEILNTRDKEALANRNNANRVIVIKINLSLSSAVWG